MPKFNLLGSPEKLSRNVKSRLNNKERNIEEALKFDHAYFDGSREQGYGGYHYDGRWVQVAKNLLKRYGLGPGSKFLDVGCAKGFLLQDLKDIEPDIILHGIDVSSYAKSKSRDDIKPFIELGSCENLPFDDDYFDAAVAINVLHNLEEDKLKNAIQELNRVVKDKRNIFIQVDAYTSERELEMFKAWVLTAKTYMDTESWIHFLLECGYCGDYFWTVIGFED